MDFDFKQLFNMIGPAVGMFAGDPAKQAAFANRWRQLEQQDELRRQQQAKVDARKNELAADYALNIFEHAQTIDDPIAMDQFARFAENAGVSHGFAKQGDFVGKLSVPESKLKKKQLDELTKVVKGLTSQYGPDYLRESDAQVRFNGALIPFAAAEDLIASPAYNNKGEPIPRPKKADVAPSSDYGRFLARYAQGKGKTVDQLTVEDELDAKKQYGTASADPDMAGLNRTLKELQIEAARNRAAGGGGTSADDMRSFTMSEKLAKTWLDASKAQREMNRQFGLMQTGLKRFKEGDKNGGSQAVLVTFQKILDPTSVVRESEYARSAAGISLLGRLEGYMDRLKAGGAGVPEGELAGMVETARQMLADMQGYTSGTRKRIEKQAQKFRVDPELIFDDAGMEPPAAAAPSAADAAKASAADKLRRRK